MTGAEAAVAALEAQGLTTVFGVPGGHSVPIYDALSRSTSLRHVLGRHEQGLAYMADGYYRASGNIGVVSTTSGPAVAGLASPLGGACTDTSAILVVSSTVHSDLVGKNRGALHDLNDALELMRTVCGPVARCTHTEEIPRVIRDLVSALRNGRPRPAFCEIPQDVLVSEADVDMAPRVERERAVPEADAVGRAVRLLAKAERPIIWTGTGALVAEAGAEVDRLARKLGACVITTMLGRGILPAHHPHLIRRDGLVMNPVNRMIAEADVILAVGTMFKQEDTALWNVQLGGSLVHIDIDANEIDRTHKADIGMVADARAALEAIANELPEREPADPAWLNKAKEAEAAGLARWRTVGPTETRAVDIVRESTPDETILFFDRCSLGYWAWLDIPVHEPRTFHYPQGYGAIGPALPQAIGAKIACPDRPVACFIGDGGFQFTGMELAVAVQEGTPITVVVCNNRAFGAIAASMQGSFGHADLGCKLSGPDLVKFADAYNVPAVRIESLDDFGSALRDGIRSERLNLIDLAVELQNPPPGKY